MIKILCFPLTKLLLFVTGFLGAASALRASSVTFEAVFRTTADWVNDWMRFGLIPGIIIFGASVSLLLFSVWKTKPGEKVRKEPVFRLWRNIDGTIFILLAIYISLYILATAYKNWTSLGVIALPILAYFVVIIAAAEIVARLRDNEFDRSLYWVHFFKLHPIWRPLGFLLALLLAGNLLLLAVFTHEIGELLGFRGYTSFVRVSYVYGRYLERPGMDIRVAQSIFSLLSLTTLTYFIKFLLGVEARFAKANAEQVRAERFKSELITNVSHDIKTPLTSIINYVDLLKAQPLEAEAKEYVAVLDKKSDRLKILIDDLMDASKAGTGNVQVELHEINLSELIGQIAGEFEEKYIENNITLVMRGTDEPIFVQGDNRHLWRVLENLFSNTVKYTLPGTRVFAELTQRKDNAMFSLKNTSATPIDLPSDSLAEQFIRGDLARESEGSGLGLYIAKSLIELMGYTFSIKTSGDLFEVEIEFFA